MAEAIADWRLLVSKYPNTNESSQGQYMIALTLEEKTKEYDQLVTKMKDEIDSGKIEISNLRGRMAVKLKDKVLFASGSAKLQDEGKAALSKLAEVFKEITGKSLRVEGHTDNVPVKSGDYATNWELSAARADAVVELLANNYGIPQERMVAAAYGEYRPVATNDTARGRALNRRIEIIVSRK